MHTLHVRRAAWMLVPIVAHHKQVLWRPDSILVGLAFHDDVLLGLHRNHRQQIAQRIKSNVTGFLTHLFGLYQCAPCDRLAFRRIWHPRPPHLNGVQPVASRRRGPTSTGMKWSVLFGLRDGWFQRI